MKTYNYQESVKEDVRDYIIENYTTEEIRDRLTDRETWEEELHDELWTVDSVTGNGSGSYTFDAWTAEENLCHNLGLLSEALKEFGSDSSYLLDKGAEAADVTIRCYLLPSSIAAVLDDLEGDYEYQQGVPHTLDEYLFPDGKPMGK